MTGSAAALVSFEESSALRHEWGSKSVPNRWNAPPKRWALRSPMTNAVAWKGWAKKLLLCGDH